MGEQAVWSGRGRGAWPLLAALIPPLAAITVGLWQRLWFSVALGVFLLLSTSMLTGVRVAAGPHGVSVRMGVFGLPRVNVPLDKVVQASALDVRPRQWGGWGYRGGLHLFHQAALVVRNGPGIRLDLVGNRTLVFTVDDAERGAAVIQAAVAGRGGTIGGPTSTASRQ